ncbi:hypothetical protein BH09MYX1_BH09MYX1_34140 [soil metagenome]
MRSMRRALFAVTMLLVACKDDPNAKLNAVRDELVTASPSFDAKLTACPTDGSCLEGLAKDLGSKGYSADTPDQASVGAVAILVARDGHAEWATNQNEWLAVMRKGKGSGADTLRLAVAMRLAKVLPTYAHALTDGELPAFFKDVSRALPGSCKTYALLGDGTADAGLALEDQSGHSACVQRDLGREGGPGGTYGQGPWRAAAALLALARETAHALTEGAALMSGKYKDAAAERAKTATDAITKIALVTVSQPAGMWTDKDMLATHLDGGIQPGVDAGTAASSAGGKDAGRD